MPSTRSVAWLQRGCGTSGLTFAQNPYSSPATVSQNDTGRLSVNEKRTIDLTDLNPYFHGSARRNGAPSCLGTGLPYIPVTKKASSLPASAIVTPSIYGQGYQTCFWPDAVLGSRNVSICTYFAEPNGFAKSTKAAIGKPVHGTAIDHASTQRWRYSRSSSGNFFRRSSRSTVISLSTMPSILIVHGRVFSAWAGSAIDFCEPNS